MPINTAPGQYLSDKITAMQRQLDELTHAVGRPSNQIRDVNDNVVTMPGVNSPAIVGRGHDVGIKFQNGVATVTDEQGRDVRQLKASLVTSDVVGNVSGIHFGDVGTPSFTYNHYGDVHGNTYGFHYGPVGDGTTQNQINALNIFGVEIHASARFFGEVGQPGGPFYTTYGDVGNGTNFFNLFGTVHAPSERTMKTDIRPLSDAGQIVDSVESRRWHWHPDVQHADGHEHAGPMADDLAEAAPWLVRHGEEGAPRTLQDHDLIGVLWAALQDARARITQLEEKQSRQL